MIQTKRVTSSEGFRHDQVFTHNDEVPEAEANLAFELVARWGMVAAVPDGEDSAGRSRLRLQTPDELVRRAFIVAELAYGRARANGLIHKTIDISELRPHEDGGE